MTALLILLGSIVTAIVILKINSSRNFDKSVNALFLHAESVSYKTFTYQQLTGLPEPVQRYFKHVLKEGQPYISFIRIKHDGKFKTGLEKDWVDITGEEYFTANEPGFIWKGRTAFFTAQDSYVSGRGRLDIFLFSLFKITSGQGEKYDHGELLRWLGESVWFPTNLLPGKNLKWAPIDSLSAKLYFTHNKLTVFYIVRFNSAGEITEMETKRYMGEKNLEAWVGKLSDYEELNGVVIPTVIEAVYRLPAGDFSYGKFNLKQIEYDKTGKF